MTQRNARFWTTVHGSPVKFTLTQQRPSVETREGGPTDEGYSYESARYELRQGVMAPEVYWRRQTTSCDCDGPLGTDSERRCPLSLLADWVVADPYKIHVGGVELRFPAWQELSASRSDQFAAASGY